jgi:sulfite oxidase
MSDMDRRSFLTALARAGLGASALVPLARWAEGAVAARSAPAHHAPVTIAPRPTPADHAEIIVRNDRPEHWETTVEALGRSWNTPNARFFARSHLSTPSLDAATWRLEVAGKVATPLGLSLAELQAMPGTEAMVTLECAGNGRGLFRLPSTSGTQWERGAVGTATWRGVKLGDVLDRAGVQPEAKHVWFEAADRAPMPGVPPFVRSIPLEKARDDVLLAWAMNGEPLPAIHGAPLRAVVPGWFGMASAKWLTRVRLEAAPSDNYFMATGYRYRYPGEDPAAAPPVEALRIKSLITRPLDGENVTLVGPKRRGGKPRLHVQGFAWAGPAGVRLVEVSVDGGKEWRPAGFMGATAPGAWREWATEIEVPAPATVTVMARATDNAGETQPPAARPNAGGYGNNSIHAVKVRVHA